MEQAKKAPVALIAALLVQTIGGLVWAGGAAARIATLEQRVGEQRLVAERLARVEARARRCARRSTGSNVGWRGSDGEDLALLPLQEKVARRVG